MSFIVQQNPSLAQALGTGFSQGLSGGFQQTFGQALAPKAGEESPFTKESQTQAAKRVSRYMENLSEGSQAAQNILDVTGDVRKAFESGNVGFGRFKNFSRAFLNSFGADLPDNADEATVTAAKATFLERAKPLFGRVTEGEVNILEETIPKKGDTKAAAEAKLAYWEKVSNAALDRQKIAELITEENGGIPPVNLEGQVNEIFGEIKKNLLAEAEKIGNSDFEEANNIPDGYVEVEVNGQTGFVDPDQIEVMKNLGLNPQIKNQEQMAEQVAAPNPAIPARRPLARGAQIVESPQTQSMELAQNLGLLPQFNRRANSEDELRRFFGL